MIKAVIFDCFGVLVGDALPQFVQTHLSQSPELVAEAWKSDDRTNLGKISEHEHFVLLGKLAGIPVQQVIRELDANAPNQPLFDYIRAELKPRYKLAILSNIHADILDELIGKENRALFDAEALSYKLGVVKPSPEIYQMAAEMLEVEPKECVFIDDKQHYCAAAEEVGMKAIHYASFEQCKRELQELLR
ncbi:MAG: HAD family hydrolase [Acidobacteriota bacterium]